jgi:serine/threonine protein kinase
MATVHFGRVAGSAGFARTVAVKRLHPHFAKDPDFVAMFLDEARLAARVQHPNVVATLDVAVKGDEVFLVMEYVHGESVAQLLRASRSQGVSIPLDVAVSIAAGVLHGLHAAHEAKSETGEPLLIVHRDVSPHNILVGTDGGVRVFDFGIAKAVGQHHSTRQGQLKGKLSYMPPEQLRGASLDRRADVYAVGVVLWELLTGKRLFAGDNEGAVVGQVLNQEVEPPSKLAPGVSAALDETVLTALSRDPARRFATARRMALALEASSTGAGPVKISEWLEEIAGEALARRAVKIARIESGEASMGGEGASLAPGVRLLEVTDAQPTTTTRSDASSSPYRELRYALAVALVSSLGLGGFLALRAHPAPSSLEAQTSPLPVETTPPSGSTSAVAPAAPAPRPAPAPAPVESAKTAVGAHSPRVSRPARPPSAATPKVANPACNPPFTWESGVKVPKAECPLD